MQSPSSLDSYKPTRMEEEAAQSPTTGSKERASVRVRRRRRATTTKITREPPLKQMMKYAVPAVLGLLMLRHQRQPDALFRENPAPLWSFVAATAVYWLVAEAMTTRCRRKRQQLMLRRGAVAFGVLSALSLVSMFLPHPFSLLPILTWMLAALLSAFAWIRAPLMNAIGKVRAMFVRHRGVNANNQLRALPVSLTLPHDL